MVGLIERKDPRVHSLIVGLLETEDSLQACVIDAIEEMACPELIKALEKWHTAENK